MKKLYYSWLFSMITITLSAFTEESKQNDYKKLKKQLTEVQEQITLEEGQLKNTIAKHFPLEQQKISFFASVSQEALSPTLILRNAPKKLTDKYVETKIKSLINFIKTHIHSSPRKEKTLQLLDMCSEVNKLRLDEQENPAPNLEEQRKNLLKSILLTNKQRSLYEEILQSMLTYTPNGNQEKQMFFAISETPHSIATSLLFNLYSIYNELYKSLEQHYKDDFKNILFDINPQSREEFQETIKPFEADLIKRLPDYYSATIQPSTETKNLYLKIWEILIEKMNFNKENLSIYTAFNTKDNLDEKLHEEYKKTRLSLEDLTRELSNNIVLLNTYKTLPFPTTECFEKIFSLVMPSLNNDPKVLKKTAATMKELYSSSDWQNTSLMIIQHKNQLGISMLKALHRYAKKFVELVENAEYIKIIEQEFNTLQKKEIGSLCESLLQNAKITIRKTDYGKELRPIKLYQFACLLITDICKEIESSHSSVFAKIKKLHQQKNTLLSKLNAIKETMQTNEPNIVPLDEKETKKDTELNPIKNENNTEENQTSLFPNAVVAPILQFTKKLKEARINARNIPIEAGNIFQNNLSDAESLLFHNIPITGLFKHPEVAKLRNQFIENLPLSKTNRISFQKKEDKLFIWIPTIYCYQINNIEKTQKGVIEIFCEKKPENSTIPELKIFHVWFRNLQVLQQESKIGKNLIKQIKNKLMSLKTTSAQKLREKIDTEKIIPSKSGWHVEISSKNKTLILNTKKKDANQNNWIFYQS